MDFTWRFYLIWLPFGLASVCYSCLFVLNSIALHVYDLCLAWTRFVICGLDLNIWFEICDELCWLVILL